MSEQINELTAEVAQEYTMSKYASREHRDIALLNEISALRKENEQLRSMLERAENALRDARVVINNSNHILANAVAKEIDTILSGQHIPLKPAGEEDRAIYNKIAANYSGQPVEDKGDIHD